MENLVDLGLVRTLGFSNFNSKQIKEVIDKSKIKPSILQVESNPRFQNAALRSVNKSFVDQETHQKT